MYISVSLYKDGPRLRCPECTDLHGNGIERVDGADLPRFVGMERMDSADDPGIDVCMGRIVAGCAEEEDNARQEKKANGEQVLETR